MPGGGRPAPWPAVLPDRSLLPRSRRPCAVSFTAPLTIRFTDAKVNRIMILDARDHPRPKLKSCFRVCQFNSAAPRVLAPYFL